MDFPPKKNSLLISHFDPCNYCSDYNCPCSFISSFDDKGSHRWEMFELRTSVQSNYTRKWTSTGRAYGVWALLLFHLPVSLVFCFHFLSYYLSFLIFSATNFFFFYHTSILSPPGKALENTFYSDSGILIQTRPQWSLQYTVRWIPFSINITYKFL